MPNQGGLQAVPGCHWRALGTVIATSVCRQSVSRPAVESVLFVIAMCPPSTDGAAGSCGRIVVDGRFEPGLRISLA